MFCSNPFCHKKNVYNPYNVFVNCSYNLLKTLDNILNSLLLNCILPKIFLRFISIIFFFSCGEKKPFLSKRLSIKLFSHFLKLFLLNSQTTVKYGSPSLGLVVIICFLKSQYSAIKELTR